MLSWQDFEKQLSTKHIKGVFQTDDWYVLDYKFERITFEGKVSGFSFSCSQFVECDFVDFTFDQCCLDHCILENCTIKKLTIQ